MSKRTRFLKGCLANFVFWIAIFALKGNVFGDVFADDFSNGLNLSYWTIQSTGSRYSFDDTEDQVRFIGRSGGSSAFFQNIQAGSAFHAYGNFDVRVDFRDALITRIKGQPGNQVQLNCNFGGVGFFVVRSDEKTQGQNIHVWDNNAFAIFGTQSTSVSAGTMRVTRVGRLVSGYLGTTLIYQHQYNTDVATFSVSLGNNGTSDVISVTFDNFYLAADKIVPLPPTFGKLEVLDANPAFLGTTLPANSVTPALWNNLGSASDTRHSAAADGITQLLLRFECGSTGNVVFSQSGRVIGRMTQVDGSPLPPAGMPTTPVGGQQMAFALYTVPDQTLAGGANVNLLSSFTPPVISTATPQYPWGLTLIQTPVVLVHGLWGDGDTWEAMRKSLTAAGIQSAKAIYTAKNAAGPFADYAGIVRSKAQALVYSLRENGIAVTRADVVAHSMGGILTRMDANDKESRRDDNYDGGYFRRVISVNTPHWGAPSAEFLLQLSHDVRWLANVLSLGKHPHPIDLGAVEDLSPFSYANKSGGVKSAARKALSLPSRAISTFVLENADFNPDLSDLYYYSRMIATQYISAKEQNKLSKLLCGNKIMKTDDYLTMAQYVFIGQTNDGVVALDSQIGGISEWSAFGAASHTRAPQSEIVQKRIIELLKGPVSAFDTIGFPAVTQSELDSQKCAPPAVLTLADYSSPHSKAAQAQIPLIEFTAPVDGSTATPGDEINFAVQPVTNANVQHVAFEVSAGNRIIAFDAVDIPPFIDNITVPMNVLGPLTVSVIALDSEGNYDFQTRTVQIAASANVSLKSISVDIDSVTSALNFSELAVPQPLMVNGMYSDGVERNIRLGKTGTSYRTSDPSVAIVDENGKVTAVGNGETKITVTNAGITAEVPVKVNLRLPELLSITPDNLNTGTNRQKIIILGQNLGAMSKVDFLRDGKPDPHLKLEDMVLDEDAAHIQLLVSVDSGMPPGLLTVVVTTPVGSSTNKPVQGNKLFIGQPLSLNDIHYDNAATGNGGLRFTVLGTTGSQFALQTSTNLVDWMNTATNILTFGSFNFMETKSTSFEMKFYRAKLLP